MELEDTDRNYIESLFSSKELGLQMREINEKISIWAFWVIITISVLALTGWLADALSLAGMGDNSVPMAPVTALS